MDESKSELKRKVIQLQAEVERLRALQVPVTRTDAKAFERRAEAAEAEVERLRANGQGWNEDLVGQVDTLKAEVERLREDLTEARAEIRRLNNLLRIEREALARTLQNRVDDIREMDEYGKRT